MLGIPDLTGVECITVVGIMKPGCLIMRLLSGLVNPDLYHELDSDPLGTVEVGEGWAKVRREALGAVGICCLWSKKSRLIIYTPASQNTMRDDLPN